MKKKAAMIDVAKPSYIHLCVGSDRYCWEIKKVSEDGRRAIGYPVHGRGFACDENPTTDFSRETIFGWKYGYWREVGGIGSWGRKITKRKEFADHPAPYLDPSF